MQSNADGFRVHEVVCQMTPVETVNRVIGGLTMTNRNKVDFKAFVEDIQKNNWNVFGVEVYENGLLTHSYGDTNDQIHDIYSATKTILSLAVGIAYDRGLIRLEDSILRYLPSDRVEKMSPSQRKAFQHLTIHRLLTMSVGGFPFRPEGDSYLDFSLSCVVEHPEEKAFNYSNICVYLVGVALTEVFQEDLGRVIEGEILKPLGIIHFEYGRCPEGYFYGASWMKLTVHELSQVGLLLCNQGVYNGKRIVSEEYVRMATSVQQMNREGGYGFYIWKYRDGFSINGKWEQKCYCLPKRGIMVTYLSHIEDDSHDLLRSMERNILGIS